MFVIDCCTCNKTGNRDFFTDAVYEVSLRNGLKLEVGAPQLFRRRVEIRTVSTQQEGWSRELYRRHAHANSRFSRKEAVNVMRMAHPKDFYWSDNKKKLRSHNEELAKIRRKLFMKEVKKKTRINRIQKMLGTGGADISSPKAKPKGGSKVNLIKSNPSGDEDIIAKCMAHGKLLCMIFLLYVFLITFMN